MESDLDYLISDEEDTASPSKSCNQKGQEQKPISNRTAPSYSKLSPRTSGLVDYDDDEDDEDYRAPPRKQPEASDEGTIESFRLKRKLPSKDKEPELVKKQKFSKNSRSKDSVFAVLCSTLSQAVLPGKKTAVDIQTGPQMAEGTSSSERQ